MLKIALSLSLAACSVQVAAPCEDTPTEGWQHRENVQRSCPIEQFNPAKDPECVPQGVERDAEACRVGIVFFCSGFTWTSIRFIDDDGHYKAIETQQQIGGDGCRITFERRAR